MVCIYSILEKKLAPGKVLKGENIDALQTSVTKSVEEWDLEFKLQKALKRIHSEGEIAEISLESLGTTATKIAVEMAEYLEDHYLNATIPGDINHEIKTNVVRWGLKKDIMAAFNKNMRQNDTRSAPSGERLLEQQRDIEVAFQQLQDQVYAQEAKLNNVVSKISQIEISSYEADFRNSDKTLRLVLGNKDKMKSMSREDAKAEGRKLVEKHLPGAYHNDIGIVTILGKAGLWVKVEFPTENQKFTFEKSVSEERKKSDNPQDMPMTTRLGPKRFAKIDDILKKEAHRKLLDDWEKATKNKKFRYLPLKESKVNLRVQHKYVPSFTVWVEFLEPQYRHRWMLVNMNASENNFDGFDFDQTIPCPVTRVQSETNPLLRQPKRGKDGKDYNLIQRGSRENKRGNSDRSEESKNLSNKEKMQKRREAAESTASPTLGARGRGRGTPTPNKNKTKK